MEGFEVFIAALFVSVAGLNAVARWLDVPYPIVLVIGGVGLGALPGVPEIELEPDLVLLVFLPPLLYSAAFFSDLHALRSDLRAISIMAIVLVLVTAAGVAVVGHELLDLSWAMAFTLGAVVSPTDPVAATTIMRRLGAPRRVVNLVEGESLVNDATALVAYKVAVAAAVGGSFSAVDAGLEFVAAAVGGVAIGLVVGFVVAAVRRRVDDVPTELTISLFTGYAAFLPADELGASGVLAAVTAGVYLGWLAPELTSPNSRLQLISIWQVLVFLLNATLFILVGLQLPVVLDRLGGESAGELAGYAAAVTATVIAVRFVWLFTMPYLLRAVDRRPSQVERRVDAASRVVVAWSGLRGAVSMAAALALPLETDAGAALPGRDLILFVTFVVILVTLLGQGLTLPALIRRLGLREDEDVEEVEAIRGRVAAAEAALAALEELAIEDWTRDDTVERVRGMYEFRWRRAAVQIGDVDDPDGIEDRSASYRRLMHLLFESQRQALIELRNSGEISTDAMRRVERQLDLEEARLDA